MPKPTLLLVLLPAIAFAGCHATSQAAAAALAPSASVLHSPIDAPPAPNNQPYDCGAPLPIGPDITVAPAQQVADDMKAAIYPESGLALHDLSDRLTAAGNDFQRTGNTNAALCIVHLLEDAASHHGMDGYMADSDAWKQQNMTLRAASLAWLKILPANAATSQQAQLIDAWMQDILHKERTYFSHNACTNNGCDIDGHVGVGVAQAAAAIAVATQNHGLFRWAMGRYSHIIRNVDDRGLILADLQHHDTLRYNIESAAGLVQLAEFGEANGFDAYSFDGGRIHLLVHTVALGILDPGPYSEAAHWSQRMPKKLEPWEVAWSGAYVTRFPEPALSSLLQQIGPAAEDIWSINPWVYGIDKNPWMYGSGKNPWEYGSNK